MKKPAILNTLHDDIYYGILAKKMGIEIKAANDDCEYKPYYFHDEIGALSKGQTVNGLLAIRICMKEIDL